MIYSFGFGGLELLQNYEISHADVSSGNKWLSVPPQGTKSLIFSLGVSGLSKKYFHIVFLGYSYKPGKELANLNHK